MKQLSVILLSSVVLALAGCGNQGGSSDPYNTESGATSDTNYIRRSSTNDYRGSFTNDYQGSARSPGRSDAGVIYSTNFPGLGTNDQTLTTDPERTNNVPEK